MEYSTEPADEIIFEFMPFLKAYKSGRIQRVFGTDVVPASLDSQYNNGVLSKDVAILPERGVSARLFLPASIKPHQKLPLLIYFHGGAFCLCSPFCAMYHTYLTSLVSNANVVAVSVNYRLAPEHPLPAAYEDAWDALKWVASHNSHIHGPESWLNDHADFGRVFVAGDSAGANISHNMVLRMGIHDEELVGLKLSGACLIHPDFVGKQGSLNKAWLFTCPTSTGEDDPRINPAIDNRLSSLGCTRMLVCVAEMDDFREAGSIYCEAIRKSGWQGQVEILETLGEGHVFHLFDPTTEKAAELMEEVVCFINNSNNGPSSGQKLNRDGGLFLKNKL